MNQNALRALRQGRILALKDGSAKPKDFRCELDTSTDTAEIYLYDLIDDWVGIAAADIVYALAQAGGRDVLVHLNSPGGMATEGLAIYSTFRNYDGKVTMRVEGLAASAASFVMLAADEVEIEPNAMVMIHDAWGMTIGPADDHRAQADVLDKMSDNIASIYAEKAGGEVADWRALMKAETWYVGQEAVDAGLADRVSGQTESTDEEAQNKWNSGIFARAPRVAAQAATTQNRKTEPAFDWASLQEGLKGVLV